MAIAFRLVTGFVIGFDIRPDPDIYLELHLGILQLVFTTPDFAEKL